MSKKAKRTKENRRMEIAQGKLAAFNLIIEQLIAALDELAANKVN